MQFLREVRLEGVGEHRWDLESGEGEIHPTLKAPWHSGHAVALPDVERELDEAAPVEARQRGSDYHLGAGPPGPPGRLRS
ncbi:MAG: hypothetical protein OXC09_11455 [Truepera sp.]|nr:hypothetical protein [Truepera sp.]